MKDEALTALGETLQRDFEALTRRHTRGWFKDDCLTADDWSEFRVIEAEADRFFHISYEFAAFETWLTRGFVPADLVGPNQRAVETTTAERATVSPWLIEERQRVGDRQSQSEGEPKGDRNRGKQALDSEAKSRLQWTQEQHTRVKGLRDLARVLESENQEGRTLGPEAAHPRQNPGSATDVMAHDRFGRIDLPDLTSNFDLTGDLPDDYASAFQKLLPGRMPLEESGSIPEEEKAQGTISPAFRNHPDAHGRQSVTGSVLARAYFEQRQRDQQVPTWRGQTGASDSGRSTRVHATSPSGNPSEPTADGSSSPDYSGHWEKGSTSFVTGQDSPAPAGLSFDDENSWEPARTGRRLEPLWVPTSSRELLSAEQSESTGEVHLSIGRESEHKKDPSHVSESDLDTILEAIARNIQQEYKRFYGS